MNVVLFGMSGLLSSHALQALIGAGLAPRAIVTPALPGVPAIPAPPTIDSMRMYGRRPLPTLAQPPTGLAALAKEHAIPLLEIRSIRSGGTQERIRAFAPDLIVVACFPWRFPVPLLAIPRIGCLNVHPSLLPENRGPDPLFWTFRHGDRRTGVTIHLMTEALDAGPIARQAEIPVEDGVSEALLEQSCAQVGGQLLVEAVFALAGGSLVPTPQDEQHATYYPQPGPLDYVIEPEWSARQCENFTRGVIGRGQPILIRVAGVTYRVVEPLGVADQPPPDGVPQLADDILVVRPPPGAWRARVMPL